MYLSHAWDLEVIMSDSANNIKLIFLHGVLCGKTGIKYFSASCKKQNV